MSTTRESLRMRVCLAWACLLLAGGCDGCFEFDSGESEGCSVDADDDFCFLGTMCNGTCSFFCPDDDPCTCSDGSPCPAFGSCADEEPCEDDPARACGEGCCEGDAICSLGSCVSPANSCTSSQHCPSGLVCTNIGPTTAATDACGYLPQGGCIEPPAVCQTPGQMGCLTQCERALDVASAPTASFASWGSATAVGDHVLAAPVVVQLDDDDCDGYVGWRDVPDVVFMTASSPGAPEHGRLIFASMVEGVLLERFSVGSGEPPNDPATQPAAVRLDAAAYLVVCTEDDRLRAYDASGLERWLSEPLGACQAPALGTLANGLPAAVVEGGAVSLLDGSTLATFSPPLDGPPVIADVASPPGNEIVGPSRVFDASGQLLADLGQPGSFVAVAHLDADATPEIVTVMSEPGQRHLTVWQLDASDGPVVLRADVDVAGSLLDPCPTGEPGEVRGGGPPSLVDGDGDGDLDVAIASTAGLVLFDGAVLADEETPIAQAELAAIALADCSHGRRAVSAFDFDGGGLPELVASDGTRVHLVSLASQAVVWSTCNPVEPTIGAFPVVDVDANGSTELLTFASARNGAACDGDAFAGVQLFSHASGWAGAPRVWLQHQQPGLPLESSGDLVDLAAPGAGLRAPASLPDGARVTVDLLPDCATSLRVRVENTGVVPLRAGTLAVELFESSVSVAVIPIWVPLDPGASTWITHPSTTAVGGLVSAEVIAQATIALTACEPLTWIDSQVCAN